ncbi:MAG: hypothetical protein NVV73_05260 [Cellvibrionaceae bacterium]|nr:hypothetical protein [Cellvibrionaceae bacterium]
MKLPADHPLHLVIGLTIWSVWFIAAYGGLSVFCSANAVGGNEFTTINIGLLVFTALTCVLLGALAVWCWRRGRGFPGRVSAGIYIAAVIATAGVGAPIIYLPPCI